MRMSTGVACSLPARSSPPRGCFEQVLGQHFERVALGLETYGGGGAEGRRAVEARVDRIYAARSTAISTYISEGVSENQNKNNLIGGSPSAVSIHWSSSRPSAHYIPWCAVEQHRRGGSHRFHSEVIVGGYRATAWRKEHLAYLWGEHVLGKNWAWDSGKSQQEFACR